MNIMNFKKETPLLMMKVIGRGCQSGHKSVSEMVEELKDSSMGIAWRDGRPC